MTGKRILLVGLTHPQALESSYHSAATHLGYEVLPFDIESRMAKYVKLGKLGRTLHLFLPVDAWTRKMNRELIITARQYRPDYLFYFTEAPVLYGTLATIKTALPDTRIVWVWPDTPMNLGPHSVNSAKLVDITATYSSSSIPVFTRLGFNNPVWVPLGGDPFMHKNDVSSQEDFNCDISFVGGWRPERERVMKTIARHFTNAAIEVHGPLWEKNCRDEFLKKRIKGGGFFGRQLGVVFNKSRININQIDDTNYPSANMRFFEVSTAGGLQVASSCPEMENDFRHKEHLLYFKDENDMLEQIQWVLDHPAEAHKIREAGQKLLLEKHAYSNRIQTIMQHL